MIGESENDATRFQHFWSHSSLRSFKWRVWGGMEQGHNSDSSALRSRLLFLVQSVDLLQLPSEQ